MPYFFKYLFRLVSIAAAYFLLGGIYRYMKLGARGIDLIPNFEIWRRLGNSAADGCDYCCRCERFSMRSGYLLEESGPEPRDDDILSP